MDGSKKTLHFSDKEMNDNGDINSERETSLLMNALEGLAVAKKREGALKTTLSKKHNRTVSWDVNAVPPPDAVIQTDGSVDGVSQVTVPEGADGTEVEPLESPPSSPNRKGGGSGVGWSKLRNLKLKDIAAASPMESEAEAYIQRTLEESDPTRQGESKAQKALLSNVPDDCSHNFSIASQGGDHPVPETKGSDDTPPIDNTYTRNKTTSEELFGLTADLQRLQGHSHASMRISKVEPTSQADTFALAAIGISNRLKKDKSKREVTASPKKSTATGGSRWNTVRQAVEVNGAAADNKKTDEEVASNDMDLESGEDSFEAAGQDERRKKANMASQAVKSTGADFKDFVTFGKRGTIAYIKFVLCFIILPATGIAALLFYALENPPCGLASECLELEREKNLTLAALNITKEERISRFGVFDRSNVQQASVSWWLLFVGVRQVITFTFAKLTQAVFIDFFCLRSDWVLRLLGPFATLMIVQAKGWPFLLFVWGVNDFAFLYGKNSFASHWLFWQDLIDLFNDENPAGDIVESDTYVRFLVIAVVVGFVVSVKRFWLALLLGRQSFSRYADELTMVMKKNLLVGQVATLARDMEKLLTDGDGGNINGGLRGSDAYTRMLKNVNEDGSVSGAMRSMKSGLSGLTLTGANFVGSDLTGSQKIELEQLLGTFEEPTSVRSKDDDILIGDIIQFRRSLSFLNTSFPFSVAFGPVESREACIKATEKVFQRLMLKDPDGEKLQFDTLALLAVQPDGSLDEAKLTDLVRLFRPDREGQLTLLDFAKCVDSCYKDLRLLRASLANASRIDQSAERIFNFFFYFLLGCIVLAVLGVDPLVLFASISGFILGFAFMIGAACSKYFEGLLLILVRRPYDIGDRIAVSNVNNDTSTTGSTTWYVRDVTLFTTTVVLAATNEMATYSNGSLAASRIVNAARSPQGVLFFLLKFPIDTPYEKLKVFRTCLEKFVNARPREWMSLVAFRLTRIEVDLGFVEYIVCGQHRDSWQNIGALSNSKADLSSFALELQKKMNMRYRSPALPVDLSIIQQSLGNATTTTANVNPTDDFLQRMAASNTQATGPADGLDGASDENASHQSAQSVDITALAAMFDKK